MGQIQRSKSRTMRREMDFMQLVKEQI